MFQVKVSMYLNIGFMITRISEQDLPMEINTNRMMVGILGNTMVV